MSGNYDEPLLSAASQITSGVPVDWNKVQDQVSTPDAAAVARELRSLERFAQVTEAVPATWGRFQIVSEIGRGTFGTVYSAIDPTLRLEVALKVIRSRIPGIPIDQEKALDEARRLVKVKHPNVVRAYGAELIDNEVGLSMELVKGQTLDEIVRRQATFSPNEAAVIGIDLCRALAAVHRADILHGDIKAHNVMREQGGRTVLMDFGTGRQLNREPARSGNDFAGTPLYIAPEVFAGRPRTPGSEIYSLGVLLYFLVTGSYPVEGDSRTIIERLHDRSARRKSLRDVRPDLPDSFIRVVEQATAESPDQRYRTAGELEAALVRVLSPERRQELDPASKFRPELEKACSCRRLDRRRRDRMVHGAEDAHAGDPRRGRDSCGQPASGRHKHTHSRDNFSSPLSNRIGFLSREQRTHRAFAAGCQARSRRRAVPPGSDLDPDVLLRRQRRRAG